MAMKRFAVFFGVMLAAVAAFAESVPGVFLQDGGWLWTEQKDGVMLAKVKMSEGTVISVETTGETDASGNPVAKIKEAEYDGSKGKTLTFAQVNYDGKSYWAVSGRFVMQKKPAVLVEDCAMYNTRNLADVVNAHLDMGSVVAIGDTVSATGGIDITELSYFSERQYAVRTVYVKASKLSTEMDDITAFKIIGNIAKTSDLDKKQALFESAEALNLSGKVRAAMQKAWDDVFAPAETEPDASALPDGTEPSGDNAE